MHYVTCSEKGEMLSANDINHLTDSLNLRVYYYV